MTTVFLAKKMSLPIQIHPNPLISTVVEIRFSSDIKGEELLSKIYSKFITQLPNLKTNDIPKDIKDRDQQFKYTPDYILNNDDYSLSFSNKVVAFENISSYKLWGNYFSFITDCLNQIFDLGFINQIERIGVRYVSILESAVSAHEALNMIPLLKLQGYQEKFANFSTNLLKENCNLFVQVFETAKATKNNKSLSGVLIDIDASFTGNLVVDNKVINQIDRLHFLQKELFFALLKPDFIQTLNPNY